MATVPTVPVQVACGCRRPRVLPLRLASDTLTQLRLHLAGKLAATAPVFTYRCRHCKEVVIVTAADLYLADDEQERIMLRHRS